MNDDENIWLVHEKQNNQLVGGFSAYKWSAWLRLNREMDLGRTSQDGTPKETNMKTEERMPH